MRSQDRGPVSYNRQLVGRNGSREEEPAPKGSAAERFSVVAWTRKGTSWLSRLPRWRAPYLVGTGKGRYPSTLPKVSLIAV